MENWVEIDLDRLKNNYLYMKNKTTSPICAVIKADGYGVGSYEIAKELENLGVKIFAVAFLKEAMDLRNFGIKSEILILNYIFPEKLKDLNDDKFIFTLYSLEQLNLYLEYDKLQNKRFHIKINSGMNRLGFDEGDIEKIVQLIIDNKLKIEGIYSHFSHVENEKFTEKQYIDFNRICEKIEIRLNKKLLKHISNSGATLRNSNYNLDFVRVGMALYGLQPLKEKDNNIKGIVTWKSRISSIRQLKKGESISYGNEVIEEDKKLAIIPVGYSHGYMRQLGKDAYVLIKNKEVKIIGKILMDQMYIDVSSLEEVKIGDEVVLLGDGVEAEKVAEFSRTIADDIISKISPRIERVFIKERSGE